MSNNIKVLHSSLIWLPLTQKWMYNMISYLPEDIENFIVCAKTRNLNAFPMKNIYAKKEHLIRFAWEEGLKKGGLIDYSLLLKKQIKQTNAAILHSHFGDQAWEDSNLKQHLDIKQVAHFYGYDVGMIIREDPRWKNRYAQLFERVDRVLCEGSFMAQSIKDLGCPAHKVNVFRLGVEVDQLPFKPREWHNKSPLKILIAGSFREKKGILYALQTLGRLKSEVSLEIDIIGDSGCSEKHKREKDRILEVAREQQLMDIITWHGMVDHSRLLQIALQNHIFISPSVTARDGDTEGGCPVTIIELSATGMPVVSTHHCDIPEAVIDGQTGYLSPERDVESLYNNLLTLLDRQDQWNEMATRARNHIREHYDAPKQGEKLAQIYRNIL